MKRVTLVLIFASSAFVASTGRAADADDWVDAMKKVHAHFKGDPGTFAQFGDSITVTQAYWAPLFVTPKNMPNAMADAHGRVKKYLKPDCWSKWKGPEYGSEGGMTIRWADEHVDDWLKKLNPETALIMFGTNDLGQLDAKEYEEKTRTVVQKCLKNGTVVVLSTIPPRSGKLDQCRKFADVVRKIAKDEKLPLVDFLDECLKRRPDDWDGSLAKFKDVPGDTYDVPTLIARDGVHPSNPGKFQDYSDDSLKKNGYVLRSYMTLMAYDEVLRQVLQAK